ncbi:hypothetical protein FACS1894189_8400 [Planctomycetales bacterium]|nr:hypothetical protein FACS1894189_8400 [Planctomycetales bacterium]
MPIQPGTLFASLLLLLCLGTNIVFYSDVRESFLGNQKVSPSEQVQKELDINVFYPETTSKKPETPKLQESRVNLPIHPVNESIDPFLLPAASGNVSYTEPARMQAPFAGSVPPSQLVQPVLEKPAVEKKEVPIPTEKNAKQVSASIPFRAAPPQEAKTAPVYADQFKPVITPSPVPSSVPSPKKSKPSSAVVWDNVDTALDQPIRYETPPSKPIPEPHTK